MRGRGGRWVKGWGAALGACLALACSPGEEGGPTRDQDPAASGVASPRPVQAIASAAPSHAAPSPQAIASPRPPEAIASPSPGPSLAPGEVAPEAYPRLRLKPGLAPAEVEAALAREGFLALGAPRFGGPPGPPPGEAWLYAESTRRQAKEPQALWLRFQAKPDGLQLRGLLPQPSPAQLAECLGEGLDNWNGRQRANALRYAEGSPTPLTPEGADLVGKGVRVQAPRQVGGRVEAEASVVVGGQRRLLPLGDRRFAEAGHLVGGHLAANGQRLALLERLPHSGAIVASYWLLDPEGQRFRPDHLDGR